MKQPQYSPLTNAEIVCLIFAGTNGDLDSVEVNQVGRFEAGLLAHLRGKHADYWTTSHMKIQKSKAKLRQKSAPRWMNLQQISHKGTRLCQV